ncbi:hypothetical protein PsAD2_03195 [Pseudovibrio axinellae]|uniref:Uncharacterized protein n=1 Tax=Pseudovibrio axinellae TaxID=989403 RepID=A0A165X3V8_9HYPH|nr:hypothetical protein [Pseudovibrio axinellae]KZL17326.1 hypothetical protein PsAD2_03195 [Pseudovibrio axinellae]SEQ20436.1 hypothetical protein SAMN05421798_102124 [Pseudovibrio axinellae]
MNNKTGLIFIAALVLLGAYFSINPSPYLFLELGPFELAQALLMVASTLVWGRLAINKKKQAVQGESIHYTIAVFFAMLSFVVLGRETSFLKVYGAERSLELGLMILTGVIVTPILGVVVIKWLRNISCSWQLFRGFMATPNFFWAIASFVFVLLGDFFEKELLPIQSNLVWEEMFELMGYFAILVAGLISEDSVSSAKAIGQEVAITEAIS